MSKKILIPIEVDSGVNGAIGIKANRVTNASALTEGMPTVGINASGDMVLTQLPQWRRKLVAAITNNSNVTLVTVTGMQFAALANKTYKVAVWVIFQSNNAASGAAFGLTIPTGTINGQVKYYSGLVQWGNINANNAVFIGSAVQTVNTNFLALVEAIVTTTAAGNIALVFRSETNGSITTVQPNSIMTVEEY